MSTYDYYITSYLNELGRQSAKLPNIGFREFLTEFESHYAVDSVKPSPQQREHLVRLFHEHQAKARSIKPPQAH